MAVQRKYERDIDILLAEEFEVSSSFADWFKSNTKFSAAAAQVVEVFVSQSNNLGESDLIIIFERDQGDRFALYLEDKVDAPLQPHQAQRYYQRARKEVDCGTFREFEIIFCAPEAYGRPGGFDRYITYEEMGHWLEKADPSPRGRYRAEFLLTAATKHKNTWIREQDDATDAFWKKAYDIAIREFPILEMKELSMTKDSTWIVLRPRDMPTMPKTTNIALKGNHGHIDLTFGNTIAHLLAAKVGEILSDDMTIHQTGASAAIRLQAPPFSIGEGLDTGVPKVRAAFVAAKRLIEFYREHRNRLDRAALEATA